jgi:penicillin amidase
VNLNRFVSYFNVAAAILLLVAAGALYWYVWRPLAITSGNFEAPVSAGVTISRDSRGVPFIKAASIEDALFAQGFATAQDRMFQMELSRRQAAGELAEILGPRAVESDVEMRKMRMRRIAESHAASMPASDRAALAAYARGVNHFIETHRGRYPVEYSVLRFDPAPWTVTDSVLVALQMFRTLTTTWRDELLKQTLRNGGNAAKVDFLFPVRAGGEFQPGSNAWAVSGRFTRSGKPILANDPHLAFSLPGIWYQVHLEAPGLKAAGVSLPGIPAVIIGRNERIAWGITNLHYDVQDLYLERVNAGAGVYEFQGTARQLRQERETVVARGAGRVEVPVMSTGHGPIIASQGSAQLALRWAAAELGAFEFPFLDLNRASDWTGFRAALARFPGPGSNVVYADVDGNIGYQAAGKLPIRANYDGDLPVDGARGEFEWTGWIPFEELPSALNPPGGVIITANQNPFPPDYRYRVNGNFAAPYRARQIQARLAGRTGLKPSDMIRFQRDFYSAFSHFFAKEMVRVARKRATANSALRQPTEILAAWNGQMDADSPAPLIVSLVFQHFRRAVAGSASPGKGQLYDYQMASAVIEKLLRERPPGWFPDIDGALLKAYADGIAEGERSQGPDASVWRYGRLQSLRLQHPLVGDGWIFEGWMGRWLRIGPNPMSGATTTVNQMTQRMGPSMRMAVDMGDSAASLLNITTGQSGQPLSPHYKDQWKAYYDGESFPLSFTGAATPSTLTLSPGK